MEIAVRLETHAFRTVQSTEQERQRRLENLLVAALVERHRHGRAKSEAEIRRVHRPVLGLGASGNELRLAVRDDRDQLAVRDLSLESRFGLLPDHRERIGEAKEHVLGSFENAEVIGWIHRHREYSCTMGSSGSRWRDACCRTAADASTCR